MTPVDQEFTHQPEIGQHGDCMRAVIASLMDLPLEAVPHFAQLDAEGRGSFWEMVSDFCHERGYNFLMVQGAKMFWASDAVYHGIEGPSPRGTGLYHIVVGCNGQVEHDPHPSRAGLAGDPETWKFCYLVKR